MTRICEEKYKRKKIHGKKVLPIQKVHSSRWHKTDLCNVYEEPTKAKAGGGGEAGHQKGVWNNPRNVQSQVQLVFSLDTTDRFPNRQSFRFQGFQNGMLQSWGQMNSTQRFCNLSIIDISSFIILGCIYCRMFSSIPGLQPLDIISLSRCDTQNISRLCQMSLGGKNCSKLRITASRSLKQLLVFHMFKEVEKNMNM